MTPLSEQLQMILHIWREIMLALANWGKQRPNSREFWGAFSNYVNVKIKIDETFITDNQIVGKKKRSYAEAARYDNTLTYTKTIDFLNIYCELLACEKSNSSNSGICPTILCTSSLEVSSSSNSQISQNDINVFSSQDEELLPILVDLQQNYN